MLVITSTKLLRPVGLFENLVNQQYASSSVIEFSCKICNASLLKIEIVHVDIETLAVLNVEFLFCILQQEGCLSDTTRSLDAYQAVVPVDFVHEDSANGCVRVLNQISMCSKECFH